MLDSKDIKILENTLLLLELAGSNIEKSISKLSEEIDALMKLMDKTTAAREDLEDLSKPILGKSHSPTLD